jgi:hypothetical protein
MASNEIDLRDGFGCCELHGGYDGIPAFFPVADDETWVAKTETAGGGGGWFNCSARLDPQERDWEPVATLDVLERAGFDEEPTAALTAAMIATCLVDGYGREAVEMATALVERGFEIEVWLRKPSGDCKAKMRAAVRAGSN